MDMVVSLGSRWPCRSLVVTRVDHLSQWIDDVMNRALSHGSGPALVLTTESSRVCPVPCLSLHFFTCTMGLEMWAS